MRWYSVVEMATQLGMTAATLRKQLERNAINHREEVGARLPGLVACKLGARWYVSRMEPWRRSRDQYVIREAAEILGTSRAALRKLLERNGQNGRAEIGGIIGRKLPSGHWRVSFERRWMMQQESRAA